MARIKESSTRNMNKTVAELRCPVTYIVSKIGGHWKPIILYHLMSGPKRYSELRRSIPNVTEKMLIQHLKELQVDELVIRKAEPVVPPYVVYSLSASGKALKPVMEAMENWSLRDHRRRAKLAATVSV